MNRQIVLICSCIALLLTPAFAFGARRNVANPAARCVKGSWVSTEYGQKSIVATLGNIPYTSVTTDTTAVDFAAGQFVLESLLELVTVDDGETRLTRADGSAQSSYRVRTTPAGKKQLTFPNVSTDQLYVYATAGGVTVGPTVLTPAFQFATSRIPFTCRGNRLTFRLTGPSGRVAIQFERQSAR